MSMETKIQLNQPADLFARIDNENGHEFGDSILLTTVDSLINWGRKNSIWPMAFGLACCAIEMMAMTASRFDISGFGAEVFLGSLRQPPLSIIARRATHNRPHVES